MAETALATAYVKIVPSFKGFQEEWRKQMPDTTGAGQEQGSKFATGFSKSVGGSLKRQLASVFAAGAVVDFTKRLIDAGEAEVASNRKLENVAKSMGIFGDQSQKVAKRLEDLSSTQQLQLGIDDDTIKSTQLKLLTFKNLAMTAGQAGGMFDRASLAAQDLAAAGFGSAEQNAVQLGKALQDPEKGITALARSGVTFTDKEKAKIKTLMQSGKVLEAQNMILKAVETQVGGTAAAGVTGSMKMKQAFAQFTESLGVALLPTFNQVADFVSKKLIPYLQDFFQRFKEGKTWLNPIVSTLKDVIGFLIRNKDIFGPIAVAIMGIVGAWKAYVAVLKIWKTATEIATAVQVAFDAALDANPIGAIIMAITVLTAALVWFFTQTKLGQGIIQAFADAFVTGFNFVRNVLIDVRNFFTDTLNIIITGINFMIRGFNKVTGFNVAEIPLFGEMTHVGGTAPAQKYPQMAANVQGPLAPGQTRAAAGQPLNSEPGLTVIYNAAPNNSLTSTEDLKKSLAIARQRVYR